MGRRERVRRLDKAALARCDTGVRRLLRMSDRSIAAAKRRDDKRIVAQKKRIKDTPLEELLRPIPIARRERMLRAEVLGIMGVLPHPTFGVVQFEPLLPVRIRARAIVDFAGNADDLAAMGITVHSHVQNVFTISATRAQLSVLASQAATRKIRLPRLMFGTLEDAVPAAEIDNLHAVSAEGNGTLVGVIDSPLDVRHHAFRDPGAGHGTRVRFLWVQDPELPPGGAALPGQTPHQYAADPTHPGAPNFAGLNYGRVYDQAAIDTALGLAAPYGTGAGQIAKTPGLHEHGTHTTGIAAGSGHVTTWATAPTEVGAAPLAGIVHVCTRWSHANVQNGVWEDDVINALNFILRVADRAGQPVVISNSYGLNVGPHTGRTEFDTLRDAMLDSHRGRSLVWSAGNDNNDEGFRQGTIAAGATETFGVHIDSPGSDLWVEMWYRGPELEYKMDCGGQTTGWQAAGVEFDGTVNNYHIEVDRDVEAASGLRGLRMYVQNPTPNWTVNYRNNGTRDVEYWVWIGGQGDWHSLDGWSVGAMTLGDTGCARSVLTVGACAKPVGANPELIAAYSGRGPTLDGRIKPEIVTVGSSVSSADSGTTGGYIPKTGTSMSAPLVAGAIALLFENDPDLNQDAIKALLTQTADRTGLHLNPMEGGYSEAERNAYGYGRLRMLDPFQHSMPLRDVDVWVRTAGDDYGFQPYPGGCFCHAPEVTVRDPGGHETTLLHWDAEHTVSVRVHNLGGTPAMRTRVQLRYTRPWAAPDNWEPCRDPSGDPIEEEIDIPDLDYVDLTFAQRWVPRETEIPGGGAQWGDHFCLLVEVFHDDDPWVYGEPAATGHGPWDRNIKGVNNVALRNLAIQ